MRSGKRPAPEDTEKIVWSNIDRAFAAPVTREEDHAAYAGTQVLAELFKSAGFDGVAYRSTLGDEVHNVALFDIKAARLINCGLQRVDGIEFRFSNEDLSYVVKWSIHLAGSRC